MPRDEQGARAWRLARVRPYLRPGRVTNLHDNDVAESAGDGVVRPDDRTSTTAGDGEKPRVDARFETNGDGTTARYRLTSTSRIVSKKPSGRRSTTVSPTRKWNSQIM
jgi:hypothetical protein